MFDQRLVKWQKMQNQKTYQSEKNLLELDHFYWIIEQEFYFQNEGKCYGESCRMVQRRNHGSNGRYI